MSSAKKSNPKLWERIKKRVQAGSKGGRKGEWSARKAQIATRLYKEAGGKYVGPKKKDNSLTKWTKEEWGYVGKEKKSRYLPKKARAALTKGEKAATSRAKNRATKAGKQFSKQPTRIAKKTAKYRKEKKAA